MTNCEYGTDRIEFKGLRLSNIRKKELKKTVEVYKNYTNNEMKIIRMGFIDGFLPLNRKSIEKVANIIKKESPKIIFAPDPYYAIDFHKDHLNTGWNVYFALKKLKKSELPERFFFYYTFKPNIAFKTTIKDLDIAIEALSQHRSQITPFKIKIISAFMKLNFYLKYLNFGTPVKKFRELKFLDNKLDVSLNFNSLKDRIRYYLFYKWMNHPSEDTYIPAPKDLGLL